MGRQSRLVLQLLFAIGVCHLTLASTPKPALNLLHDDIISEKQLDSLENYVDEPKDTESAPNAKKIVAVASTTSSSSTSTTTTTEKPFSEEILRDLLEVSKHSVALAEDPRFNKMLPEGLKLKNATKNSNNKNSSEELEALQDEYNYGYGDEDYDYEYEDETTTANVIKSKKSKISSITPLPKLQPLDDVTKTKSKTDKKVKTSTTTTNNIDDEKEYSDEEIYDDEDDDEDDNADEEEIVFSEDVPCPRYCTCARNLNSYMVATCSRLDPGTQKFGSDITDIVVANVGPKYPILLGPKFFHQLGLKHVASIKIANCTIEYMHPEAFHGLEELYSVNLSNVGLAIISPDTFVQNRKLRMLTISGNDLNVMSSVHYLLKSSSLEELDLSRNNLMELNPNAFSQLSNIVYINLSQNNLQKIPEKVFDTVETIEELDLSYNQLKELPEGIFNRTALAILHLKYNAFTSNLNFGTNDLQQLDLSLNSIKHVHHGMFDKMTGLTNLNLKGNGITKIQPDSFMHQKNLRHIDLSMNEMDQLSSMLFFKNSELDVIRLNDNPRLSQLPTDGFLSYNGYFTVFYLDISNCAIGALGHRTFSTMPHLATLKLAWNNINNLERDTFASLTKLTELDLSNNLVSKLDDLLFMENNELTKLNLGGNPIRKLSTRLFMPLNKLRELDVSDCELTTLLADKQFGTDYKFYKTLRSFNASANQIKKISSADIKNFKELRSLDVTHNPLKCNEDFQDFISYVSLHTHMMPKKMPMLEKIEESATVFEMQSQIGWSELAHEVCKHNEAALKKDSQLEKRIEDADHKLDEDEKHLLNIVGRKMQKILKDSQKNEPNTDKDDEELDEEEFNNGGEDTDEEEDDSETDYDDEDDDDDDDDNDNDEQEKSDVKKKFDNANKKHIEELNKFKNHGVIKNHGINVEQIDSLPDETNDEFLLNKLGVTDDNDDEDEIIIERGRIYYTSYNFMIPIIIVVTCVIFILLAIVKVVAIVLRKRGDRYRMALLAASKNSIVYQKLSEDIVKKAEKEPKMPKVHKYAPIDQV